MKIPSKISVKLIGVFLAYFSVVYSNRLGTLLKIVAMQASTVYVMLCIATNSHQVRSHTGRTSGTYLDRNSADEYISATVQDRNLLERNGTSNASTWYSGARTRHFVKGAFALTFSVKVAPHRHAI